MSVLLDRVQNQLTTTDATATTILSYPIVQDSSSITLVLLTGRNTSSGKSYNASLFVGVHNIGGVTSVVGAPALGLLGTLASGADATMVTCGCSISTSGANLVLKVSGILATSIQWAATILNLCNLSFP